jgi:hypothetical protein
MTDFHLTRDQHRAIDIIGGDASNVALGGGSRSGKTFLFCRSIVVRAMHEPNSRHAVFRFRFTSVKAAVILDTMPKVIRLCFPELPSHDSMLNKSDWYTKLPNGSEIWYSGLDDQDRVEKILGLEYATLFFNECSQIPYHSVITANTRLAQKTENLRLKAYYDLNPPSKKHWTYILFIEKRDPITKKPVADPRDYDYQTMNPQGNMENLDKAYLKRLEGLPERARNRFLLGRFADDTEGQLWTEEMLAQNRVLGQKDSLPEWLRVVVAIDPSGCSGSEDVRSDEIGIVVVALGTDSHAYLLEDLSGRYSPSEWADVAVEAYYRYNADRIIGEKNYGGAMVESNVRTKDETVPFSLVSATRGKVVRAEPISSLYEQNRVHHVGYYPELEDQLCAMTLAGYVGLKSPDRGDALIWGLTELFPRMINKEEQEWHVPSVITQDRSARRFDKRRRY